MFRRGSSLEDEFGDVVGKARRGLGLALDELARLSGVPVARLARLEECQAEPADGEVAALAASLRLREGPLRSLARRAWEPFPVSPRWDGWALHALELRQGGLGSNTYLLWREPEREAAVVDPGFEPQKIGKAIADLRLCVRLVLVTHGHQDHVGHAAELARRHGIPAWIGAEDLPLVPASARRLLTASAGGERLPLGGGQVLASAAPGHTAGGRCYEVPGACFVGDTLFAASIGRTFGGPGDYPLHLATVREGILALPPETRLFPGHGPATTVAQERANNPFAAP